MKDRWARASMGTGICEGWGLGDSGGRHGWQGGRGGEGCSAQGLQSLWAAGEPFPSRGTGLDGTLLGLCLPPSYFRPGETTGTERGSHLPQQPSRAVAHPPFLLFSVEGADGGPARGQARPKATVPRPGAARQASHPRQASWVSSCHPGEAGGDGQGAVDRPVQLAPRLSIPASGLRGYSTQEAEARSELSLNPGRLLWVHPAQPARGPRKPQQLAEASIPEDRSDFHFQACQVLC